MGISVGRWAQLNHVLESHLIGDPTFTFAANKGQDANQILTNKSITELLSLLKQSSDAELKNLILTQLFTLEYADISNLLLQEFDESSFSIVRYTCLALGVRTDRETQLALLTRGSRDEDEFIRRHSLNLMGQVGDPSLIAPIVQAYIDNQHASRILFNVKMTLYAFDQQKIKEIAEPLFNDAHFQDNDNVKDLFFKDQFQGFYADINKDIFDQESKYRKLAISALKNVNYHPGVPAYLQLLKNKDEKEAFRIAMLQSLAWFGKSYQKIEIQQACLNLIADHNSSKNLRDEAQRTLNTLN